MKITKKVRCIHCQSIIEHNGKCNCEKVKLIDGVVIEGNLGKDYLDISARLLNEGGF